ncbi:eukaryotic translation initiation factor 4 gamma 2 isoform X1 [Homalodisca vitripennis]|uniref:eukaryotic translation initiation factor 4 gamma 2 isoform X1 n=2 Tax=Homalodisca vitripennis TaxID=197043 RepID=UPI001EEA6F88|nr:eukaryotic translation initiation factor 4 gamma 2 isoform X1 [Homalodisca vitripennis]
MKYLNSGYAETPLSICETNKISPVCRVVRDTQDTTDGPRGPGGASRVSGGRDDSRSLQSTKRRWVPPSTVRRDAQTPENRHDQVFRKVRGILNKLTPEKFQKLSDDLLQTELNSSVILKGVIFLIFEKALDEPKYSSMYAQLCKRLTEEAPNFDPPSSPCTFRVLLLNKCKTEFENRSHASEAYPDDAILSPEDEERKQNAKRKMLGNIKFIGELGKLEILAEGILHRCIQQLLGTTHRNKPMAEDLECLCQIMRTCGRNLDTDMGAKLMEQYFKRMEKLAKNNELPSRIRFMLQDTIELRRDKWVPRKATSTEGPMPINQLCEEENGRINVFGTSERRQNFNPELFRRTLKTRSGFDDVLGGPLTPLHAPGPLHPHEKFNSYNGYQSGYRQNSRQNHHQQQFYPQNRYNNQHNNNNNNTNNSGGKELAPRFKKMSHQPAATNLDEISLRPPSNSMVFNTKQLNTKPQISMPPVNNHMPTPHPVKENVVVIKPASVDKNKNNKKEKGPSKEEVLKKVLALGEDMLRERSVAGGVTAWRDHRIPERLVSEALVALLSFTLDKTEADRELALTLVATLRKEGLASTAQVLDCLRNLVNSMAEREATVPKIHSHVAGIAAHAVTQSLVTLDEVAELTEGGSHYPLFMLTLQNLHRTLGKQDLTTLFNKSKVNLLQTLPEADRSKDRLSELLDDRSLGFLCPLLRIQAELWDQLEADQNPSALYKWIKDNLEPAHHVDKSFISALVTVVVKFISQEASGAEKCQEREKALLEKYKPVLNAFLNNHTDLQVVAVYALQTYCFSFDFPKGMLLRWFVNLYDLEVIEEDAFLKWREDITDAYPGKGKALFQVNTWLTWLETVSSEEEDEEDA